ncbi:LOW QUALITY PROTEIN: hypothetical protein PHMEG_00017050 [Phytophthora megakarya]|uniref:Reverse transcriptase/retrotransposon-derived protein RNase H-like domain-containing protein n=1 Tax=Phytophthora megakarya TaxID=4795 RepID=A0A225VYC5_9STRA|nr:LOW QUALITY PROTEIN: hypothetical protein PHMEG_00017050 [Phytophthora megakarya]
MHEAEEQTRAGQERGAETIVVHDKPKVGSKFEADREAAAIMDPVSLLVNSPTADMFKEGEADESSQDFAVYAAALYQVKDEDFRGGKNLNVAKRSFTILQQKVVEAPILRHFDRAKLVYVMLFANEWALSSTLLQNDDEKLHPVRFCGRVLKDAEMNYHPAEKEVLALLLLLKTCYTQLVGKTIHVHTRFSTLDWVHKSKTLFGRTTQFAVMLSPWRLVVTRVNEKDCAFAQLVQAGLTSFLDLEDSLEAVAPAAKRSLRVRVDPELLYARLLPSHTGFVISFDGSAKTEKYEWAIVTAASAFLESTTVNVAEYSGMNNGVTAALDHGAEDLVITRDPAIPKVIACKKDSLMTKLNHHRELTARLNSVRYFHVVREYNRAADSLASEALESKTSKVRPRRFTELTELNRIREVIYKQQASNPTHGISSYDTGSGTRLIPNLFFDFVRSEPEFVTITTTSQAKSKERRVWFADQEGDQHERAQWEEANGTPTEVPRMTETKEITPTAVALDTATPSTADAIELLEVQCERRRRIAVAQNEELRWHNLKAVMQGDEAKLGYKAARDALKMYEKFVLSEEGILLYEGANRRKGGQQAKNTTLRLVVPTTMIQEVLQN